MVAASAVASIAGGVISSQGAKSAAKTQAGAANSANALQQYFFDTTQQNLKPYMETGKAANSSLYNLTGVGTDNPLTSPLLKPIEMDEATLRNTPGYKFNRSQGLKATQNAAAARGLGSSGAALKGAATYATGLADSTYQNQFNNAVTNQTNQFNRLYSMSNSGQNAAAGLGGLAQQTGASIGNNIVGAANAQGAASIAGSNAIGSGISGIGNSLAAGMYGPNNSSGGSGNSLWSQWFGPSTDTPNNGFNDYQE